MTTMVDSHSLDTQIIRRLKRAIYVQAQSEAHPAPHSDAGQEQPQIVIPRSHNDSASVEPNNFTFNTQTPMRAPNFDSQDLRSIKSSPIHTSARVESVEPCNMYWSKSFAYGFDGSGDTQPMDSQTFKDYSDLGSSRIVLPEMTAIVTGEKLTFDGTEATMREIQEGQVLHNVNLIDENELDEGEDFDDVSSPNGKDATSPGTDARIQAQTADLFKQPFPPRTPLNPGTKRKRSHEMETPDMLTSSTKGNGTIVRNLLGQVAMPGLGTMTQLFINTQVGSSPAPRGPHSDSPFTKPSPRMFAGQNPTGDSSASSPVRPSTSDGLGHDPVNQYRRIEESQESRAIREQRRRGLLRTDTLEDDDFDRSIPTQPQRHLLQKEEFKSISATSLAAPNSMFASPMQSRSKSVDNLPSDRYPQTPASKFSNAQPISPDAISDVADEPHLLDTVQEGDCDTNEVEGIQVPMTSSKRARLSQPGLLQVSSPSSSQHSATEPTQTQLTVAVQDSQGEPNGMTVHKINGRTVQSSAFSAHLVQQSQYSDPSTETRAINSQRNQARIEHAEGKGRSAQTLTALPEDAMPSSPPVQFSEHDHEYDVDSDLEIVGEGEEMVDVPVDGEADGGSVELELLHVPSQVQTNKLVTKERQAQVVHEEEQASSIIGKEEKMVDPIALPTTPGLDTSDAATRLIASLLSTPPPPETDEQQQEFREQATAVSTGTEVYDTAATHQAPASSRVQRLMSSERQSPVSPIKRLQDIAAVVEPRRPGASFESQELDAVIDNILSDADLEYLEATKITFPTPRKRARTYKVKPKALREPSANINLPNAQGSTQVALADLKSESGEETGSKPVSDTAQDISSSLQKIRPPVNAAFKDEAIQPATMGDVAPVSEPAEGTLVTQIETPAEKTPSSALRREAKGAKAAFTARRLVASRRIAPFKKEKQVRKRSLGGTRTSHRRHATIHEDANKKELEKIGVGKNTSNASPIRPATVESIRSTESSITSSAVRKFLPVSNPIPVEAAPSTHKVLALFKGKVAYWYPATYLGPLLNGEKCKVRFCDGTIAVVEVSQTRVMELKVNDVVKVDIDGMRKGTYLVQGFDASVESSYTDAQGHKAVKVVPHATKDEFMPQSTSVSIEQIYVTGNMLRAFSDRKFFPPSRAVERLSTPAFQLASEPTTPESRSRRQAFNTSTNGQESRLGLFRGVFNNMAFAITFADNRDEGQQVRDKIAKDISSNGGSVLDSGFEALFDTVPGNQASPKTPPGRAMSVPGRADNDLGLRLANEHLGFTAVIADRHCRTKKYLEALALGIPCLHHRWISDCITQSTVLPFDKYMLPAGDSEFLAGAVRSRTLATLDPASEGANLKRVIEGRFKPLDGHSVLLVMSSADKRNAYRFLARAAGAVRVKCVHSLIEAKKVLDSGVIFDIALYDGDKTRAQSALVGNKKQDVGVKKRKLQSDDFAGSNKDMKTADSEFLVQSLILGAQASV